AAHASPRAHAARAKSAAPKAPRASAAPSVAGARDSRARLHRSAAAKDAFLRQTGHPKGWPGHVVDHIVPLACGGADSPGNMQWQTVGEAKAKDKVERKGCATSRRH